MEEIVIFGHPSLRTKSSEITEFNNELEKLSERMIKIMYSHLILLILPVTGHEVLEACLSEY